MTSVFAAPSWEVANIRLENRAEGGLRARVVLPGGGAADRATAEVSVIALAFTSGVPTHVADARAFPDPPCASTRRDQPTRAGHAVAAWPHHSVH